MSLYDDLATTAAELISEFGMSVTITRDTRTTDPVTGAVTGDAPTTYTPKGIVRRYDDRLIDGTRILASDRELVLDNTVEPIASDKLTIDGEQWDIVTISDANPAGTPIVYFVQVRR